MNHLMPGFHFRFVAKSFNSPVTHPPLMSSVPKTVWVSMSH